MSPPEAVEGKKEPLEMEACLSVGVFAPPWCNRDDRDATEEVRCGAGGSRSNGFC